MRYLSRHSHLATADAPCALRLVYRTNYKDGGQARIIAHGSFGPFHV
jgi:hypothetical protein